MQAATIKLTEDIKKGSAFAHGDVHPSVPDVLEDWLDSKRQVLRLEEEAVSLLPSMDTLPPPVRCDSEAVGMLRTLFDTFFKSLEKLLSCVEKLQNKWGKLTEIDRVELNNCIDQVRRHVIAPEDCYHCFTELNFTEERVECTGSLLTLCNNTEVIRLSSNPALKEVAHLPPHAHTLLACACSVEQIHVESADVLVLGVSYNRLSDLSFLPRLPSLTVLDVSFNHLFDLAAVTEAMRGHPSLLNVRLFGNPISYLDVYRRQVSADCPQIERLDNKIVSYEERKPLDIAKLALQAQSLSKLAVSPRNKSLKGRRKSDKAVAGAPTTEELSEWDTLFHQTLAAAVQLVSASGLDQLAVGKSVCVNHMDDIKPGAPLWEQALDPRLAHPEDVLAASQIQGGGKKQTNKAAHQLPLFECHSSVVLLGTWGEEDEGVAGRGTNRVQGGLPGSGGGRGDRGGRQAAEGGGLCPRHPGYHPGAPGGSLQQRAVPQPRHGRPPAQAFLPLRSCRGQTDVLRRGVYPRAAGAPHYERWGQGKSDQHRGPSPHQRPHGGQHPTGLRAGRGDAKSARGDVDVLSHRFIRAGASHHRVTG
ncbi:hypothetical protein ADEAN_000574500 [Angomonas deanei]|uniref:Leucine Rich repeat n=1 Tax=Angomonas deanei TaxID=59799 RepID=A0A7G2CGT4_9TRYP|nr:hypothetical protein ADEAN_000574500 [Angomonas deanei]